MLKSLERRARAAQRAAAAVQDRKILALRRQLAASEAALQVSRDRGAELERWLRIAVDASMLMDHPRHHQIPDGALAAGQMYLRISNHVEIRRGPGRRGYGYAFDDRAVEVEGNLELFFLSRRFDHVGRMVTLTAGADQRAADLEVQLDLSESWHKADTEAYPVVRFEFKALVTKSQRDPAGQAHRLLHAVRLRHDRVYVMGLEDKQ